METQERIDELEARLAMQDHSILELSDEIYRQQRRVAHLEDQLRILATRLEAVAAPAPGARDPADEVPPHY